jgi:hypothetical protein
VSMSVSYKPRLSAREFGILAAAFLDAHPPAPEQLAAFAERVYRLGYEHGYEQGGTDTMATWLRDTGRKGPAT